MKDTAADAANTTSAAEATEAAELGGTSSGSCLFLKTSSEKGYEAARQKEPVADAATPQKYECCASMCCGMAVAKRPPTIKSTPPCRSQTVRHSQSDDQRHTE